MFTGKHNTTLDEKNRMAIPAGFRKEIDTSSEKEILFFTIDEDFGNCISLYPNKAFHKWMEVEINSLPKSIENENRKRKIYARTNSVDKWDKQGRVVIPQELISQVKMEKEITIIGYNDKIEIWDKDKFAEINN